MTAEFDTLLGAMKSVGYPEEKCVKLKKSCESDLARGKPTTSLANEGGRRIRAAAQEFAAGLPALEAEAKVQLARTILLLDGDVDEAHKILGHERQSEEWVTADEKRCRTRRGEIATAVQRARKLEVEVVTKESDHPFLTELLGHPGVQASWGNVTLHSDWSEDKTARVLRETVRALAVSGFLRSGALELRQPDKEQRWILLSSKQLYQRAVDLSLQAGGISENEADTARTGKIVKFADKRGFSVRCCQFEGNTLAALFMYFCKYPEGAATCLSAGHINWVTLEYFGSPLPSWTWTETDESGGRRPFGKTGVAPSAEEQRVRAEYVRLGQAGIVGCRSYMAYLAERGEDPPWSESMLDQIGKITGEPLLKATSVVEFLQQLGPIQPLLSAANVAAPKGYEAVLEKALGEPLGAFEGRWRQWLLPARQSLVDRLAQAVDNHGSKGSIEPQAASEVLRLLKDVRTPALKRIQADTPDVKLDVSLSEGAQLHARYLNKHPTQQDAWPDMHEEYAESEGFTPAGALAAGHSVIHPGGGRPKDAIDGWMGTFYHRLPLIDPGLMRVGWGLEGKCAVMDVTSLHVPASTAFDVVWPYDGMSGVPTRFNPEMPNPIPAVVDQRTLGYPVTLQHGLVRDGEDGCEPKLRLFDGKREVDCYFSTPLHPTNPEIAPQGGYCLIPKANLQPSTKYNVEAVWERSGRRISWWFETGN